MKREMEEESLLKRRVGLSTREHFVRTVVDKMDKVKSEQILVVSLWNLV